ncbi:Ftr1 protein [Sistotremastrum niveocremeum HHB9708]|uniref:Ftr1 protein n=1 Tax=Sistotremastrum niveocremeum HHB9708 TaxID=1314777 RepID=A0A164Z262_9AGAM|nr:Ftr1 protein [Sistotremastrum niveocremeum HHB9708]
MAKNLFSVPIFFIVFRECLEASLIIAILLGLVEQIVHTGGVSNSAPTTTTTHPGAGDSADSPTEEKSKELVSGAEPLYDDVSSEEQVLRNKKLIRKLRIHIFIGAAAGFILSLAIGGAFIAVWFTQASDLWQKSEELWEGIFSLIASLIIFIMGITMLKMDRAKATWRIKLARAFEHKGHVDASTRTGRWALVILPFVTVLREGMEAVVFVGGVSLGQQATSIPIAAIVGLICGIVVGYIIYAFASRSSLTIFLIIMTNFILLIGAGLFSKAVGDFQENAFNRLVGGDIDDTGGDGPGSFSVNDVVWHLDCCNPENNTNGQGWSIFGAIFGWTNTATVGTVLSYVFYWICVIVVLVYMKWSEGRTKVLGKESAKGRGRRERREARAVEAIEAQN